MNNENKLETIPRLHMLVLRLKLGQFKNSSTKRRSVYGTDIK